MLDAAAQSEDIFGATCLTPATAPTIRRLAELEPTTLAIMHGSSNTGDPSKALRALADDYEHCGRGPFRCTRTKVASSASRSC